ncbi:hypothetical protein [Nannocystis sp.]|uniref:hypothetical protein n=1 Tax=Nannocystis sp. TaxID=1962667 RepID=UPI0024248F2A|nr:hypothetical protein [Nannocystis sp.]MBK7827917.1 hypothetical protein [Nannocystis sp.]MBK9752555.1 hypothetical protein [Nannocystis sp.]
MSKNPADSTKPTSETPKAPATPQDHAAPVKPPPKEVRQPSPGDEGASTDDGSGGASAP